MEDKEILKNELWNLQRKADQSRSMHNAIKDNYSFWNKLILAYVTIGSAIDAMLIFANISSEYEIWIGISAASIFIVSLIPTTFSFESKITERNLASKLWGQWIRTVSNFCNAEIDTMSYSKALEKQKGIVEDYKNIMNDTPSIPDRLFNKLKQKHLQKIEISKELDKSPFKKMRKIKKELSEKC